MKDRRLFLYLISLTALVAFIVCIQTYMKDLARLNQLLKLEGTQENLRAQELPSELHDRFLEWGQGGVTSSLSYMGAYFITGCTERGMLDWYISKLEDYKPDDFKNYIAMEKSIWEDLKYFPVPLSSVDQDKQVSFGNSWLGERTYGGKRGHEGTDVMASENQRGIYPVISMTDGVVEKIGWLPQGGYRIGIRAPHGAYFYYAHLYDYARIFSPGDEIKAGEWIGFMGDSGYSEVEGTVGNFDVHLHVGIYVDNTEGKQISVNSYWPLRYLENKKLTYAID